MSKYYTSIVIEKELWLRLKQHCEDHKLLLSSEFEKAIEDRLNDFVENGD